ncbi:MAG: deoxyribodipyrimidine photo-lyase [Rhodocyclaceae bacterium]|nr:deoxyribodipyrimidine photo-lyase [Rhodocyclaceae bacterium]MBP6108936.1 deoxyribodipyrimidine photo-lyase [Rhodocyclaceae bacterium]
MPTGLVWFRRDLRSNDHAALHNALQECERVFCVFIFDTSILAHLPRADRRVEFILLALQELDAALRENGGALIVRHGDPIDEIPRLVAQFGVDAVYLNRDDEPSAIDRDEAVQQRASTNWRTFKDQVIFEGHEVLTQMGKPFSVFTPYKNAWLKALSQTQLAPHFADFSTHRLALPPQAERLPTLAELGFETTDLKNLKLPTGMRGAQILFRDFIERIDDYAETRNFPATKGPSYLSAHLRFGTISIRQLVTYAQAQPSRGAHIWLSELIWRDFYHAILWHHPGVVGHCFKPQYDNIRWDDAPHLLAAWQHGNTGYPLVDAAMRQLLQSGYMHNRLRMVVASFLTKDLGADWRLGEAWFAEKLLDFDLAANNGGWQWAASTGCDAQLWFRIFNPVTQSENFDAQGKFIRRYVPELAKVDNKFIHAPWKMNTQEQLRCGVLIGRDYPAPVIDHAIARQCTLARYKQALS